MGCSNHHMGEESIGEVFLRAWEYMLINRDVYYEWWKVQQESENLLEAYYAKRFVELTQTIDLEELVDDDFMLKVLSHIKIFEDGTLVVIFLDGSEVELKSKEG